MDIVYNPMALEFGNLATVYFLPCAYVISCLGQVPQNSHTPAKQFASFNLTNIQIYYYFIERILPCCLYTNFLGQRGSYVVSRACGVT